MKQIKLILLLFVHECTAPLKAGQELEDERQEIIAQVIKNYSGLQDGFRFLQSQGLIDKSFQDFLQQNMQEFSEDEEFDLDMIVGRAEDVIALYLKEPFLSTLHIAINAQKTFRSFENEPLFAYVMKHKNDYMHDMSTLWLYEWSEITDNFGNTPLHSAAEKDSKQVAEILTAAGAHVNIQNNCGNTSLHIAAWFNRKEIAELLIAVQAHVNTKNKKGNTPLHCAARNDSKEVVEILTAAGAHVDIQNNCGNAPLHGAALYDRKEVAEFLIAAAAHLNIQNNDGDTPLHGTAWLNNKEVAKLLIAAGAHINTLNLLDGMTPLMRAALHNSKEVAKLLIAQNADITIQSHDGKIAEQYAGTDEMRAIFKQAEKQKEDQPFWRQDQGCVIS